MSTAIIKPQWGFLSIVLMVLGFVVWWPLGLAMLAYVVWGEYFGGSAERAQAFVHRQRHWARTQCGPGGRHGFRRSSGNAAFHEYMRNLRMARDREEFDRFMRDRRDGRHGADEAPAGTA